MTGVAWVTAVEQVQFLRGNLHGQKKKKKEVILSLKCLGEGILRLFHLGLSYINEDTIRQLEILVGLEIEI